MIVDDSRLTAGEFEKVKIAETIETRGEKSCRPLHSPLWQADSDKIRRMAPIEFIGRYMPEWFDYAICDEIHQLAGDTAQGNALGTLASCTDRIVGLTGTLLGGYADDLFNTLFRLEARRMKEHGYEWGTTGRSSFIQDYGVLETITKVEPANNACSKAKSTSTVRRKPGASPLLFGEFLMQLCAFVFLEDISGELPPYEETYLSVPMDAPMREAYRELEEDMRKALKAHRGNRSVLSTMLNTLLLYPDHPYGIGTLYGTEFDPELKRRVRFVIAEPRDLPEDQIYSKERKLIEEIKKELAEGRRCQVFAVYTQKHDVTARLQRILSNEGIRTAVLRASVDTSKREAWYARQVKDGVQVVICHPKLVETGLDLLDFPTIIFYESGYSLHTLRQASRRSWRIGQRRPVRVKFLCSEGTMQTSCLRLMGKKLLVALTMEGKFAGEGLQTSMKTMTCSRRWRGNWSRGTASAILPTRFGEPSTQNIKSCFQASSQSDDDASSSKCRAFCWTLSLSPRVLLKALWTPGLIVVFGQRPQSLSRKEAARIGWRSRNKRHSSVSVEPETIELSSALATFVTGERSPLS